VDPVERKEAARQTMAKERGTTTVHSSHRRTATPFPVLLPLRFIRHDEDDDVDGNETVNDFFFQIRTHVSDTDAAAAASPDDDDDDDDDGCTG
jgi:hypothetical protein